MRSWEVQRSPRPARSLVVSQRAGLPLTWLCLGYEFEDLLVELEPADLVSGPPVRAEAQFRLATKVLERYSNGRFTLSRSYQPADADYYDLTFFHCGIIGDLLTMGRQRDFARLGKKSACYISELWASRLPLEKEFVQRLQCFDVVFIGCAGPVEQLSEQIGRPCYYIPPAVDVLRTCPYPELPERCVDVFSVGRRREAIHQNLLLHSQKNQNFFYVRDTMRGLSKAQVVTTQDHRQQLLSMLKRSKYFMANRPKFDKDLGANTHEVGYRFFEGAAAGCVMIGDAPENQAFDDLFGWSDVVIPNPEDPTKIVELIEGLEASPERISTIRQRNVVESLRRHDWAYRWQRMLEILDLPPSSALTERLARLTSLANQIEAS